ncbi:MAG: hypothetical protein JST78_09575 [Bacteroidetes bacterium]|nr:hypothetical protein [Bacteroidota bacterium]
MRKTELFICCLLTLFAVLVSCKSTKPTVNSETTTIVETVHDTIFKTEKDSSSYKAYLDCVNGKAIIKEVVHAEPGRNLKSPTVRLVNNTLQVDCEARAQELFAKWKSTVKDRIKYIPVNVLTWWQKTQIYGFRALLCLLLICLCIWLIIKQKRFH